MSFYDDIYAEAAASPNPAYNKAHALFYSKFYYEYLYYTKVLGVSMERLKADSLESMAEVWISYAHMAAREPYREARRFTRGRRYSDLNVCGLEEAGGLCSRRFWGHVGRAMRVAFLASVHRELGTTYRVRRGPEPIMIASIS